MPDKLTVDKILNHNLYAKGSVDAYNYPGGRVVKTFDDNQLIGSIYSWKESNGDVWYMFYQTPQDYDNFNATWVKDGSNLNLPDAPAILKAIQDAKDQEDIDKNGMVAHLLKKYAPWIVGGVVVAIAAPSLLRSSNKNVSGMKKDDKNNVVVLIGAAAAIYFLTKKKRSGSVIVDPLDQGEFPDPNTGLLPGTVNTNAGSVIAPTVDTTNNQQQQQQQLISYIGPFPVSYINQGGNGIMSGVH